MLKITATPEKKSHSGVQRKYNKLNLHHCMITWFKTDDLQKYIYTVSSS